MTDALHADARDAGRERPAIERIGRRQLEQIRSKLSPRDGDILRSVAMLHIVTTRQVQRLHFNRATSTPLAAARATQRSLARLQDLRLLDRPARQIGGVRGGSATQLWRLTYSGARLVDDNARRQGSFEPSLAHVAHVLEVAELVVRLVERSRTGAFTILSVETEPACWRPYTTPRGDAGLLKPDLRLTLSLGGREHHWFVEVDRNTESSTTLARKIARYLDAWHDGSEERRAGVFPGVLWSVPDKRRADLVERLVASTPDAPNGMFVVALRHAAIDTLAMH